VKNYLHFSHGNGGDKMLTIPGYTVGKVIHEGTKTIITSGTRNIDHTPVLFKMLQPEYLNPFYINRLYHEFEISKKINDSKIAKIYELLDIQGVPVLVVEDFGGIPLSNLIHGKSIDIELFLDTSIKLAEILQVLEDNNIIHKDINPKNILIKLDTGEIKLTDFGISVHKKNFSDEEPSYGHFEGTIQYISPEQTGRMNSQIDHRTDYYSLGVTLYEMLTGEVPFKSNDIMELVYFHLAQSPIEPYKINKDIPVALSRIVMKLLNKMPDDRYKSAYGLLHDLKECRDIIKKQDSFPEQWEPGQYDHYKTIRIPQKLYGRDKEIKILQNAFERVCNGNTELVLISGYYGTGKTSLVNELKSLVFHRKGHFITGKFEESNVAVPYYPLIQALKQLVFLLLTSSEDNILRWKEDILKALGNNSSLISDYIPEIELIIGKQPKALQLDSIESNNRFHYVFKNFINIFARLDQPLVIFLDDMQFADNSTLKLLQSILSDIETGSLLFIGASNHNKTYRENPYENLISELQKEGAMITNINLSSISLENVTTMLSDIFPHNKENTQYLASLIYKKTEGNPAAIITFINSVCDKKLIYWDSSKNNWYFDINGITSMEVSDNVVESLKVSYERLSYKTRKTLQVASCIGVEFNILLLSMVLGETPEQVKKDLYESMDGNLVVSKEICYALSNQDCTSSTKEAIKSSELFRFSHPKVYSMIYTPLENEFKVKTHYKIGCMLIESASEENANEKIYETATHLNLGSQMISDIEEKLKIVFTNLAAGRKAKLSSAYEQAISYLSKGISLLPENIWEYRYDLSYSLYLEMAECLHLNHEFEKADDVFSLLLYNSKTNLDKAKVFKLRIRLLTNQVKIDAAIDAGLEALKILGVKLPKKPSKSHVASKYLMTKGLLMNKSIEDLFSLPVMTNPHKLAIMEIFLAMMPMAYLKEQSLFVLIVLEAVSNSILYGNSYVSAATYGVYSLFISATFGDYPTAYKFGQLGLRLNEMFNNPEVKSMCYFNFGWSSNHWMVHARENLTYLNKGIDNGLESGDFVYAAYCMAAALITMTGIGENLNTVYSKSHTYLNTLKQTKSKDKGILSVCMLVKKFSSNLSGITQDILSLSGSNVSEEDYIFGDYNDGIYEYYFYKLYLLYLFGRFDEALKLADKSRKIIEKKIGVLYSIDFYYLYCLSITATYEKLSSTEQAKYLRILKELQKKFKVWSKNCTENFLHKYLLIKAEMAKLQNAGDSIAELYNDAIKAANESGYVQHEAIANELAGKYFIGKGINSLASAYLKEAKHCYQKWGASQKVAQLYKEYPELLEGSSTREVKAVLEVKNTASTTTSTENSFLLLDMATVLKATQAISSEIILEDLLKRLIQILLENTGAQKVCFILKEGKELYIKSFGSLETIEVHSSEKVPVWDSNSLPLSIVNYVSRTKKSIILENAIISDVFGMDIYVINNNTKSVLCAPVIDKGNLKGIIYLENSLLEGAFTEDRLNLLNVIASQMSISIENAKLYSNLLKREEELEKYRGHLEELVDERTKELSEALDNLRKTQNQLIDSEKMAALGQLVAGIAHEINTPLGAIQASIGNILDYFERMLNDFPELISLLNTDYQKHFTELIKKSVESQSVYSSKEEREHRKILLQRLLQYGVRNAEILADLLVEMRIVDNIEFILPILQSENNLKLIRCAYNFSGFFRNSKNIGTATERASKMVFALKSYAHFDNSGVMAKADIVAGIETVLTLYHNQLKHGIEIVREYDNVPKILCYPDELNQVWTNIIHNALQAMEYKGKLTLSIKKNSKNVIVSIKDTGKGIPLECQHRIFEPFFTTKPQGEGTGLGLDIVSRIIERHHGSIEFESVPGCTVFTVKLPI